MSYEISRGDTIPAMAVTVQTNGVAVDVSDADTVEMHWVMPDGTARVSTLTAVSAIDGQFAMEWEPEDTDQAGIYFGHVVVTTDDDQETFPSDGSRMIWFVNPSIADYDYNTP